MHTCTIRLFLSQSFILVAITVLDSKKERDREKKDRERESEREKAAAERKTFLITNL